jgi:hypothetical protein
VTKQSIARRGDGPAPDPINPYAPYEFVGPGMTRQFYLDQLAATGYTGWYDENGVPAPWPNNFCDPGGDWQPNPGAFTARDRPF